MGVRGVRRGALGLAVVALVALLALVAPSAPPAAAQGNQWTFRYLAPLPGGLNQSQVLDVNSTGWAVGHSGYRPTLWSPSGQAIALPVPPGQAGAIAFAINDWGLIVGTGGYPAPSGRVALAWFAGQVIPVLAEGSPGDSFAFDVNERGDIVGCHASKPYLRPHDSPAVDLPMPTEGCAGTINDWGAIGGSIRTTTHLSTATLWYQGQRLELPPTDPPLEVIETVTRRPYVLAQTIDIQAGTSDAVLLVDGQRVPLAPTAHQSVGTDVNEHGIAVGTRQLAAGGPSEPVLWVYGTTVPLASLSSGFGAAVLAASQPIAINDSGWIVGNHGTSRGWVLQPQR
jgi:hypothetical protein